MKSDIKNSDQLIGCLRYAKREWGHQLDKENAKLMIECIDFVLNDISRLAALTSIITSLMVANRSYEKGVKKSFETFQIMEFTSQLARGKGLFEE
jgi:hypothetical protein